MIDFKILEENQETLENAISKYGEEAQIEMMIEECSELITALQKLKRLGEDPTKEEIRKAKAAVYDEIADVLITVGGQSGLIWYADRIEDQMKFKIERLQSRIENNTHAPAKAKKDDKSDSIASMYKIMTGEGFKNIILPEIEKHHEVEFDEKQKCCIIYSNEYGKINVFTKKSRVHFCKDNKWETGYKSLINLLLVEK